MSGTSSAPPPRSAHRIVANLNSADLNGAKYNDKTDLNGAKYNDKTVWPDDFDPIAHGAVNVESDAE